MTLEAVASLFSRGPALREIILVSNNSSKAELDRLAAGVRAYDNVQVHTYDHPFNYQKVINFGVEHTTGKFLLLINNDTELKAESQGLIERMVQKASRPDVGVVGCTLLYGDGRTIQHGGVFLRPKGQAEHMYAGRVYNQAIATHRDLAIFPYDLTQDMPMTAVTGAVQVVQRSKYDAIGGMDVRFIICGGDVDLCIRLNKAGYQTWYLGGGFIIHKESQSRSFTPIPYNDFYWSYLSYMQGFDINQGDPFLPAITNKPEFK